MSRKEIRENVFRLVYETIVGGEINELTVSVVTRAISEDDKKYFDEVFYGINKKREFLASVVKRFARSYEFDRLYKVDISILYVAIYEIMFLEDVPYKVSVNEAVELAKAYSTEKSASYINGILASVISNREDLKNECADN